MTLVVTRPNATDSSSFSLTGGATLHAVLSDDSDSSYASGAGGDGTVTLPAPTAPGGSVLKTRNVRARLARPAANGVARFDHEDPGGSLLNRVDVNVSWASATTVSLGIPPDLLSVERLRFRHNSGGEIAVYEVYVDSTFVELPVTNVTAPVEPITDTNLPVVTWTNTLDADGGVQTRYEVKVYTDAQYGAGGFDPDTSAPFETSGEVVSAVATWTPSTLQPDDTYRAYVRVAQTVNGSAHWSDWDFIEYDLAVALPGVPTLTLTEDENDGRIVIDLDDNTGTATTDAFEIQRSTDGGTTWEAVRLETDTAGIITGTAATAYDYEAPNGTVTQYRARALHDYSGTYAASAWTTGTVTFSTTDVWLKAPERPSLNITVQIDSYGAHQRSARQGIHQPLGRSDPVVVSEVRVTPRGTVRLRLDTFEDQAPVDALLDSRLTLLLQVPARYHEPDRYIQVGDQDRARLADKGFVEGWIDTLAWVQVAAPTGVVDDWPAGTS